MIVYAPEPQEKSDVKWLDGQGNEYRLHSVMLIHSSPVFKDLTWENETTVPTTYSREATEIFTRFLYEKRVSGLTRDNAAESLQIFTQYALPTDTIQRFLIDNRVRSSLIDYNIYGFTPEMWQLDEKDLHDLRAGDYCEIQAGSVFLICKIITCDIQYHIEYVGIPGRTRWVSKCSQDLFPRGFHQLSNVKILAPEDLYPNWEPDGKQINDLRVGDYCEYLEATGRRMGRIKRVCNDFYEILIIDAGRTEIEKKTSSKLTVKGTHKRVGGPYLLH